MINIGELIEGLSIKDNKFAYECLKQLQSESEQSNAVYQYFDNFVRMVENDNSYIRTRGLILISANAKWDTDNKIDEIIDDYLKHILDEKPITARQCIKSLPNIAKYKPDLAECICAALQKADTGVYESSMQSLVYKDIVAALKKIK